MCAWEVSTDAIDKVERRRLNGLVVGSKTRYQRHPGGVNISGQPRLAENRHESTLPPVLASIADSLDGHPREE